MKFVTALAVGLGVLCLELVLMSVSFALDTIYAGGFGRWVGNAIGYVSLFPSILLQSEFKRFGDNLFAMLIANALFWAAVSYVFYFRKKR